MIKRLIAALLISVPLLQTAKAQDIATPEISFPRNEFSVSCTVGSGLQTITYLGSEVASYVLSAIALSFSQKPVIMIPMCIPSLSFEYDRWINEKLAVGGIISADVVSAYIPDWPISVTGNFSLLPDVKYVWLNLGKAKLYAKAALGVTLTLQGESINDNFQVTVLQSKIINQLKTDSSYWKDLL
ncbi:MAG: hypothetical protein J5695_03715, partial [Bacteroidales bacterium]|nr:hypothetical protein [Bacteroidales bacterium]